MFTPLLDYINYIRKNRSFLCAAGILMFLVTVEYTLLLDRCVYAHDSLLHISSYFGKLCQEGRWVNYYLYDGLKYIPVHLALLLSWVCFSVFAYKVGRSFLDVRFSLLLAMFCLLVPQTHALADWPLTLLTMYVLAGAAACTVPALPKPLFFLIYGILFAGCVSNLYFCLPLLFLRDDPKGILKTLLYWIMGYVVGHCFAQGVVYFHTDHFIQLGDWRKQNYVTDMSSLWNNVCVAATNFKNSMRELPSSLLMLTGSCCVWYMWDKRTKWKTESFVLLLFVMVMVSLHAHSLPTGITVSSRSLHCLTVSLLVLLIYTLREHKVLVMIAVVFFSWSLYEKNVKGIKSVNDKRLTLRDQFAQLGYTPHNVDKVLMLSKTGDFNKAARAKKMVPQTPVQWQEVPYSVGFKRWQVLVYDTAITACLKEKDIDVTQVKFAQKAGYEYACVNGVLLLKIIP